jgi:CheY-like chemotaxis protein
MEEIRRSHPRGTIRFYGEMVDLLCERGNYAGAIALERLCQDLFIREPQLVILCGYARERFPGPGSAAHFDAVCGLHTHLAHPGDAGGGAALLGKRPPLRDTAAGPPPSHVYVIDDDPRIRRSLGRLLGLSFTQLRLFESAEDFLAGLDDLAAGCMVIDIQLGGMSGLDLLARMRTVRPAWPAIVMSATDNPALPGKALALGARLFLAKPFNPQLLVDAVAAALA